MIKKLRLQWTLTGHMGRPSCNLAKYMSLSVEVQYRRKFEEPRAQIFEQDRQILGDRKSTRLNSSHSGESRMPSSA